MAATEMRTQPDTFGSNVDDHTFSETWRDHGTHTPPTIGPSVNEYPPGNIMTGVHAEHARRSSLAISLHNSPYTPPSTQVEGRPRPALNPLLSPSQEFYMKVIHERMVYYDLRVNYATQRSNFLNTVRKYALHMDGSRAMREDNPRVKGSVDGQQETCRELDQLNQLLVSYETNINDAEARLDSLETALRRKDFDTCFNSVHKVSNGTEDQYGSDVHSAISSTRSRNAPSTVQEYYQHASAIRYLSDELISLGPRPIRDSGTDFTGEVDPLSIPMSPEEYARRHLQLIRELQFARQEEARLKKLCIEREYHLEASTEGDVDETYRNLLGMMETGPPRIDSLLADHAAASGPSGLPLLGSLIANKDKRITQWVATVPAVSNTPVELEPAENSNVQIGYDGLELIATEQAILVTNDIQTAPTFYGEVPARRYSSPSIDRPYYDRIAIRRFAQSESGTI